MPHRIQRQRSKGWKMPEDAVYVGRPGKWGNPFFVGHDGVTDRAHAVRLYREFAAIDRADIGELRGKNLACWCPLDEPCHADVLLELANKQ